MSPVQYVNLGDRIRSGHIQLKHNASSPQMGFGSMIIIYSTDTKARATLKVATEASPIGDLAHSSLQYIQAIRNFYHCVI